MSSSNTIQSDLDELELPSSVEALLETSSNFDAESKEPQISIEEDLMGSIALNDCLVKTYLDEILLILINRRNGACGQEIVQDLYRLGCSVSQGTVYPHLHSLTDDGILEVHQKRNSKQFNISDHERVTELVRSAFEDLGSLSAVLMICGSD